MPLFVSAREKRLWLFVLLVVAAIFSTLLMGRPLQHVLSNPTIQLILFLLGMLLTGSMILVNGLKAGKWQLAISLGLAAVYILFFFRLGAAERSHLMEYSVLAVFLYLALSERDKPQIFRPAFRALFLTICIGMLDEGLQLLLPERVFDLQDIAFNSLAALLAIGGSLALQWLRKKATKHG